MGIVHSYFVTLIFEPIRDEPTRPLKSLMPRPKSIEGMRPMDDGPIKSRLETRKLLDASNHTDQFIIGAAIVDVCTVISLIIAFFNSVRSLPRRDTSYYEDNSDRLANQDAIALNKKQI